jgi:sirohydrochlorin ferrochelatase
VLYERWVEHERSLGAMVTRTIALLDAYGPALLQKAVAEMIERGTHDTGALAILCEQHRRQANAAPLVLHFGDHVRERDVIPHDLGGYDDSDPEPLQRAACFLLRPEERVVYSGAQRPTS